MGEVHSIHLSPGLKKVPEQRVIRHRILQRIEEVRRCAPVNQAAKRELKSLEALIGELNSE